MARRPRPDFTPGEKPVRLYLAIIGDGYLYGASRDPAAAHATGNQYWIGLRLEHESFEIVRTSVPVRVAEKLEAQGTSDQEYSDGYTAMRAALEWGGGDWVVVDDYHGSGDGDEEGSLGAVKGGRSWDPRGAMPTERDVLHELRGIQSEMERHKIEEDNYVDVRLQVNPADGEWSVHYGDPSYDQDHRGYWGSSGVNIDDDDTTLRETAKDLISQVVEHAAQDEV